MKDGDKIVCIEEIVDYNYKPGYDPRVLEGFFEETLSITKEEVEEYLKKYEIPYLKFIKGKYYELLFTTFFDYSDYKYKIIGEDNKTEFFKLEDLNIHFLPLKEYRKAKLVELSDINFLNELRKNIKK